LRLPSTGLVLFLLAGCAGAPRAPEGVCRQDRNRNAGPDVSSEAWLSLLLHGYDANTGQLVGAPLDCTGTPIAWQDVDDKCAVRPETPLPVGKLMPSSVVVANLDTNTRLVWVQLQRFADGDALGPLARVEVRNDSLVVLATGSARAGPERTRLRLEQLNNVEVAVLEGDRCEGTSCQRLARLIPQRGRRFIPEPLRLPSGSCIGSAAFGVKRVKEVPMKEGIRRIFELESTLAFSPTQLVVHEQLFVRDRDTRLPTAPLRLYRSAQDDRLVTATPDRLVVDKPSLWAQLADFSDAP
jgi:hypothetical protein